MPLDGKSDFEEVGRFGYGVASVLVARDPEHLTQEFAKADRGTRIFLDVGRNGYGATFAAPYTVRPKPGAPISAPCTWEEIESGAAMPQSFTLRTMAARIDAVGDLWADMRKRRRSLRRPIAQLRRLLGDDVGRGAVGVTVGASGAGDARGLPALGGGEAGEEASPARPLRDCDPDAAPCSQA